MQKSKSVITLSRDLYNFLIFFRQGIAVQNFIIVEYVQQILGRMGHLGRPLVMSPEKAHPE